MPTLPYVPEAYDYGPTSRIAEMMLRAAQQQAQARYANAENLGRGIANAGQAIGDVLQQRQASQQQAELGRRDAAWVQYIQSGEWQADPREAFQKAVQILGPQRGQEAFKGLTAFQSLGSGGPEQIRKDLGVLIGSLEDASPQVRSNLVPAIKQKVAKLGIFDPEQVNPNAPYDDAAEWPVYSRLGRGLRGEKVESPQYDLKDTAEGLRPFNPLTGTLGDVVGQPKPKDKQLQAVETAEGIRPFDPTAGSLGDVIGQKPPKVAAEPSFQAKEVLDDAGKPVMANFNARTGQYMNAQTGQPIQNPRPVPSAAETQDARKFKQAAPILASVSELSERINTGQGLMAKASGEVAKAKAKANYDDDVAEYEALVLGFTPLVARALGHTGVLTEQDVQSVRVLFPKPGDSKSLRDRKVARITKIIGELESAGAPAPAGGGAPANNDPLGLRQ